MKKFLIFVFWISLSALYLFPDSTAAILSLRLNLWVQMMVSSFVLASGGAVLQLLLKNPLADPWLLGITGASSLGVSVAILLGLSPILIWRTGFSLIFSLFILVFLMIVSRKRSAEILILMGVGLNALFSALVVILQAFLSPNNYFASLARISGHFSERSFNERLLLLPAFWIMLVPLICFRKELLILTSGDLLAESVGVDAEKMKRVCIFLLSISLSLTIALSGSIAFIGLATPHLIKRLFRLENTLDIDLLLPISGILILLAALPARMLPEGVFVPVGSLLALFGAPIFLWLLFQAYDHSRM